MLLPYYPKAQPQWMDLDVGFGTDFTLDIRSDITFPIYLGLETRTKSTL